MTPFAVTLGRNSLTQLGVSITDITLLYEWGRKFGNFMRAAENDADLVEVLNEPLEVFLPRSSLIEEVHMRALWPNTSFAYQGQIKTSSGESKGAVEKEKELTKFGWLMVAVVTGLDLCLSQPRVLNVIVDVLAVVLQRETEVEESLRIALPKNIESWRQVGRARMLHRHLEMHYRKARRDKVGSEVVPQLNEAEEREMGTFLVWLMKKKNDNDFRAIPVDVYALAAGFKAVGVGLKLDGPRNRENEIIVEYCTESISSPRSLGTGNMVRAAQVSYPLRNPKAMIQSIPAKRQVLNRMGLLWDRGCQAAEKFVLVAESEMPVEKSSEIFYRVKSDDVGTQSADTKTLTLAGRAFPVEGIFDTGMVLEAVEDLLEGLDEEVYVWLHRHTDLSYLQRTATTTGSEKEMGAMLLFQALVFGFYFRLVEPLVSFELVKPDEYCQGLWGFGSNTFLAMCVEFANIIRREDRISRAHILFMLSSMYNGRQKPFPSTMRHGLVGILGSVSLLTLPLVRAVDTPHGIGKFVMIDLPIADLVAADPDGEIYAGMGNGVSFSPLSAEAGEVSVRKPLGDWSVHARMGVSVEGGMNGVIMAAKCSGRLIGWFSPLAADVVFLSTAYEPRDHDGKSDDYDTATVRGLEIADQVWQDGRLPRLVGQDCFWIVQSWGCAPLRARCNSPPLFHPCCDSSPCRPQSSLRPRKRALDGILAAMSSPASFIASSPLSITSPRRTPKSQFTYKQLHQLKSYSTTTPLRMIAHVDLDAFYAQCETVRLGISPDHPLAVQQWQGLIAINYPARAFGLGRHITSTDALKLCPELRLQHVATWKEGDEKWAYHEDAFKHIATHKVSLDPYRLQSRRILKCIKECLPEKEQRVEKASIDEVFMDLSAQVHRILLERYPELSGPAPYDDPTEPLPKPPTTVLDWKADALIGMGDEGEGEEKDPDWDDVCMAIASEIVRDVRQAIWEKLHYTCSAGIAKNKMLAKLGSAHKKPNQQTIIRNRAVQHFLSEFKFTKIRMLGGKLGDEIVTMFNTDTVKDLLDQPLEQLKKLGDDTGSWLYSTIRGEDNSEVNPRTQIKSMLSAKSFRPAINSFEQGVRWLRIFVADIFSRCVEEGVLENKRRPKTINLHHRQGAQTRSRSSPISQGKPFSEAMLFDLAKNLLAHIVIDGRAWPCLNLSLSVAGFEDGITNNKGIGSFLVRGEAAKAMLANESVSADSRESGLPPAKRRRRNKGNIADFFGAREGKKDFDEARSVLLKARRDESKYAEEEDMDGDESDGLESLPEPNPESPFTVGRPSTPPPEPSEYIRDLGKTTTPPSAQPLSAEYESRPTSPSSHMSPPNAMIPAPSFHQQTLDTFICSRCNVHLPSADKPEHEDFHFAMDLSKEMRQDERKPTLVESKTTKVRGRPPGAGKGRGGGSSSAGMGKGQAKLAFGKG
ncbi:hypothetical protein BCR34DRAFT_593320 [Clohesyomyces aquaticus]|uniref:DNA polymerase eta n=1 Tax=Clohesyomyces aquaticus TaxID=1231657 RepID=A0A1Y1YKB2_9PLEO|nr:hypothetical protein BCR34DRAFT_593320 [Clohesyomyces aquaticus]